MEYHVAIKKYEVDFYLIYKILKDIKVKKQGTENNVQILDEHTNCYEQCLNLEGEGGIIGVWKKTKF